MRGTLRARLVATVLLLVAVAVAVVSVATALTLRDYLRNQIDDDLRASTRLDPPPGGPPPLGGGPRFPDALTAVVRDGRVVSASAVTREGGVTALPASEYPDLVVLVAGAPPVSADLGELGDYRLLATRAADGDVGVTGLSEARQQGVVARLVATELAVATVALLGAGAAGLLLVRRALRPLDRVAATAARVSTLPLATGDVDLADRVPVAGLDPRGEVGRVGAAFNRMLEHVAAALGARQASETQLRQFVADASHELRTPLAAIRGYAELSRRDGADTGYALTRISAQAERMTTLVEDLLLLARLDAGRPLEHAALDLTRLVLDAVDDAHAAGPDHRWRLALPEEPVTVTGDAARLAQVLGNLVANARTHTPPGTAVTVAIEPGPGGVRLSVLDEGPGIAPELLPHVFERFARGSAARSRRHGSTGLGLAIVEAVTAAHGGSVEVASRPGHTEFAVLLPT